MTETTTPGSPTAAFYGIVIGIDKFDTSRFNLAGCVNDAVAIYDLLTTNVGVLPANIQLLLAPLLPVTGLPEGVTFEDAKAATIQRAFDDIVARVQQGNHVVVYYATHGARFENPNGEWSYVMVPQDFPGDFVNAPDWRAMIPAAQLNHYLRALTAKASVSVIADTCHSQGSLRSLGDSERGARGIALAVATPAQWAQFTAAHAWADLVTTKASAGGSGLRAGPDDKDWVLFAACRAHETAKPFPVASRPGTITPGVTAHGLFTAMLLKEIGAVPGQSVAGLRWMDLQNAVQSAVATTPGLGSSQTPTLEGRAESTPFGGRWTPFAPGYAVTSDAGGVLRVKAGLIHGLDEGAVLESVSTGYRGFHGGGGVGAGGDRDGLADREHGEAALGHGAGPGAEERVAGAPGEAEREGPQAQRAAAGRDRGGGRAARGGRKRAPGSRRQRRTRRLRGSSLEARAGAPGRDGAAGRA